MWRRWEPDGSALKMRDKQSSVRDGGTVMFLRDSPAECGTVESMHSTVSAALPGLAELHLFSVFTTVV